MKTLLSLTSRKTHFGVFFQLQGGPSGGVEQEINGHDAVIASTHGRLGTLLGNVQSVIVGVALSVAAIGANADQTEAVPANGGGAIVAVAQTVSGSLRSGIIPKGNSISITPPEARDLSATKTPGQAEKFLNELGIADPRVIELIKSGDPQQITAFVGEVDLYGFGKKISELHKDYMGCIIADEITHALKGTDAEMIILSENLYTRNGIPEIQADILEDKNPHLFAKYMEWRARSLKEQIGYANEIVRVRQNTAQIRELIATVKRMNAKNSGLLGPKS